MDEAARRAWQAARPGSGHAVDTACAAPWVSLEFDPSGWVYTCCANQMYPLGRIGRDRLADLWGGPRAQVLRDSLRRWDLSNGCASCRWHLEHGRLDPDIDVYDRYPLIEAEPSGPSSITFALSNRCNLACVMCTPELSSTIRRKAGRAPLESPYDDVFFEDLAQFLPGLSYAKFLGGEPFLITEHHRVWDLMVEAGGPRRIQITTNGTVWTDRVEATLARFDVDVTVSVDGATASTYESIRGGASFKDVVRNIDRFAAVCRERGTELRLCFCLMDNNAHELHELLEWGDRLGAQVSVNVVSDEGFALYQLATEDLEVINAGWARQDAGGQPLTINESVWRTQVEQMHQVLLERRSGATSGSGQAAKMDDAFIRSIAEGVFAGGTDLATERARLTSWASGGPVGQCRLDAGGIVEQVEMEHGRLGITAALQGLDLRAVVTAMESADGRPAWASDAVDGDGVAVRTLVLSQYRPVRGASGSVVRLVCTPDEGSLVLLVAEDRIYDASATPVSLTSR